MKDGSSKNIIRVLLKYGNERMVDIDPVTQNEIVDNEEETISVAQFIIREIING